MSKFTDLDVLIVARIAHAPCTFTELQTREIDAAATPFLVADRYGDPGPTWRILDRRLQALRKQGHIGYQKGQWHLTRSKGGVPPTDGNSEAPPGGSKT